MCLTTKILRKLRILTVKNKMYGTTMQVESTTSAAIYALKFLLQSAEASFFLMGPDKKSTINFAQGL